MGCSQGKAWNFLFWRPSGWSIETLHLETLALLFGSPCSPCLEHCPNLSSFLQVPPFSAKPLLSLPGLTIPRGQTMDGDVMLLAV